MLFIIKCKGLVATLNSSFKRPGFNSNVNISREKPRNPKLFGTFDGFEEFPGASAHRSGTDPCETASAFSNNGRCRRQCQGSRADCARGAPLRFTRYLQTHKHLKKSPLSAPVGEETGTLRDKSLAQSELSSHTKGVISSRLLRPCSSDFSF